MSGMASNKVDQILRAITVCVGLLAWWMVSCGGGGTWCFAQTTPVVVAQPVACATSTDGTVVGVLNPLSPPIVAAAFTGTLPAGNYYTQNAWYDAAGHTTLVGPEVQTQLTGTGELTVNLPSSGMPALAAGMRIYIGSTSGGETLQGSTTGAATFTQSTPLASGVAVPASNTTVCQMVANDAGWPAGTGYTADMTTPAGAELPGFPQQWQLLGPGQTINLGNGFPLYNGQVTYPVPLLARPYNHASQSISGPLSMTGYALTQISKLGVGTSVPGWPIDVATGAINASGGYILNGGLGVTTGQCLLAGSDPYHTFNVPGNCVMSSPTLYYQRVQTAASNLPQQGKLNFLATLTAANNTGNGSTDVGLPALGTAGTYTSPVSITFDAYGRETAVTSGAAVSRVCNSNGCYRIEADGTIVQWGIATGCASTNGSPCSVSVTWPHAFTTSSNISVVPTVVGWGNCFASPGSVGTSGFLMFYSGMVYIGGSGSNCPGTQTGPWVAVGY